MDQRGRLTFQYSMMGSAVWAGKLSIDNALALTDVDGISVASELDRLGWHGDRAAAPGRYRAAFELHIEQGPILEQEELEIGVVTGVQGLRWFTIDLAGFPAHAGPTPMADRRDPARAIAAIIDQVYGIVDEHQPWARATFAQFASLPVSPNTVPVQLVCSLDLRHPDVAVLDELEQRMRQAVEEVAAGIGVEASVTMENDSSPVAFDADCIAAVTHSVEALGFTNTEIVSGAGHDACYVAGHCPTSMIFVPCDDGLSHNEAERISPEQAERGASVLLGAVLTMAEADNAN